MERWERELDKYLTTPPAEPESVGHCANCEDDLFNGVEYTYELNDCEWYCSDDCYFEKMRDNITTRVIEAPGRDDD